MLARNHVRVVHRTEIKRSMKFSQGVSIFFGAAAAGLLYDIGIVAIGSFPGGLIAQVGLFALAALVAGALAALIASVVTTTNLKGAIWGAGMLMPFFTYASQAGSQIVPTVNPMAANALFFITTFALSLGGAAVVFLLRSSRRPPKRTLRRIK